MPPTLSDFVLESASFEIRYSPALLHWDRAGTIWAQARTEWQDLKVITGEPNKTTFRKGDAFELSVMLDRLNTSAAFPDKTLTEFATLADRFVDIALTQMQVAEFERVGLRVIYTREVADNTVAAQEVLSIVGARYQVEQPFGIDGDVRFPRFGMRWEGQTTGATGRLEAEHKTLNLALPFGIKPGLVAQTSFTRSVVVLDLDYFTTKPVPSGSLRPLEWIPQVLRTLTKDPFALLRLR